MSGTNQSRASKGVRRQGIGHYCKGSLFQRHALSPHVLIYDESVWRKERSRRNMGCASAVTRRHLHTLRDFGMECSFVMSHIGHEELVQSEVGY